MYEAFKKLRPGVPLRSLHGKMKQFKRMAVFYDFCEVTVLTVGHNALLTHKTGMSDGQIQSLLWTGSGHANTAHEYTMHAQFGKLGNCTVWAIALHIRIQDFFGGSCVLT